VPGPLRNDEALKTEKPSLRLSGVSEVLHFALQALNGAAHGAENLYTRSMLPNHTTHWRAA